MAQEALRLSESRYRRLFETAQDGILLLNSTTAQIEDVNPYLVSMLGYSHEEFLGKKLWEVGAFADIAQSKEMFSQLQSGGYARLDNLPLKTKAGKLIDVEFVSNSYSCEGLKVIQCNIRNISDRTAAEAEARLRTRLYAALSACNKAIAHCTSEVELFTQVCRIVVELGGMRMAWIGVVDLDSALVHPVASFGDDHGYLLDIQLSTRDDSPFGHGPTGTAIRKNRPVWSMDAEPTVDDSPWRAQRARSGLLAYGALPLHAKGAVIGALSVYSGEVAHFNDSTRDLLLEIAADIDLALDGFAREGSRARAEAAVIESEAQLAFTERTSRTGGWSLDVHGRSSRRTLEHDRIFGYAAPLAKWSLEIFLEHVLPEDRALVDYKLRELVARHVALDHECRIRRADGEVRWIRIVSGDPRDGAERAGRVSGMVQDITERKQIEQALRESQQRFAGVLDSAMDAILTSDESGALVLANPAAARMFGYSTAELRGLRLDQLIPERFRVAHASYLTWFGNSGTYSRKVGNPRPIRGQRRNGEEFSLEAAISVDISTGHRLYTAILRDITEREQAAAQLEESKHRLELATASAGIGIWDWDLTTNRMVWDARMFALYGLESQDPTGALAAWHAGLMPEDRALNDAAVTAALAGNGDFHLEFRVIRPDGEVRHLEGHAIVQRGTEGSATRMTGVSWDISQRKQAEVRVRYLNRVYSVLSAINALIVRVRDRGTLFREVCSIAATTGGFRLAQIGIVAPSGGAIQLAASASHDSELHAIVERFLASSENAELTMMARAIHTGNVVVSNDTRNDPQVQLRATFAIHGVRSIAALPLVVDGKAIGAIALFASEIAFFHAEELKLLVELSRDVAFAIGHIHQQERLEYLAYFDDLTELANRTGFIEQAGKRFAAAAGRGPLALLLIDLERFRNVNDSLGRAAGDLILEQVAQWLTRNVGGDCLLARVGADHFAVLGSDAQDEGAVGAWVASLMEALLRQPFRVNGAEFRIAAKGGVALFPDHGADPDTLLRHSEVALKKAKGLGDRYVLYTKQMTEAVAGRLRFETQLRQALERDEFVLHYQPKVSLASGSITGAEALIRWHYPGSGLVPPGQFIPVLEETGMIYEVGRWALRTAVEDHLRWRAAGLPAVRVAVNVSALQLRDEGFIAEIERIVAVNAQAAAGLEIEITESLIMEDVQRSNAVLQVIRAMGVSIAIDDFGTGFSSLSYLARLPVNALKIDRSFVTNVATQPDASTLVATIISMAHSMKLTVVAEGVETDAQCCMLRSLGCDEMQGFLLSRPVPRQEFESRFLIAPAGGGAAATCR
jgi:diguanylate cyclase (GGDEF)-like protein/PAS domain S-box-containing protein